VWYLIHINDERNIQAYTYDISTTARNFLHNDPKGRTNVSAAMTRVGWREARLQPRLAAQLQGVSGQRPVRQNTTATLKLYTAVTNNESG
jgi:carbonic anhydrase